MMIDVATAVGMEEPIITPVFPQSFNQQIRRIEQKLGKVIIKIQIVSLTNVKPPVTKVLAQKSQIYSQQPCYQAIKTKIIDASATQQQNHCSSPTFSSWLEKFNV